MPFLSLVTVIVADYDPAIAFFTGPLGFEPYGRVAVFLDVAGNRWDLLGPPAQGGAGTSGSLAVG